MMLEKIREYFEKRMIKKVLKKASSDIFTQDIKFAYLADKYLKDKKGVDKLLICCILTIASDRTPSEPEERFWKIQQLFYETLKIGISANSFKDIIEIQQMKAEKKFLETKLARMTDEELLSSNEYSFSSMQYKLEKAGKGPITPDQYDLILKTSQKLESIEKDIELIIKKDK